MSKPDDDGVYLVVTGEGCAELRKQGTDLAKYRPPNSPWIGIVDGQVQQLSERCVGLTELVPRAESLADQLVSRIKDYITQVKALEYLTGLKSRPVETAESPSAVEA